MRIIIQRVISGGVAINNGEPLRIRQGLVCLFGAGVGDTMAMAGKLAYKTAHLRIFEDEAGKMNRSAVDLGLDILAVPNFTLYADAKKGLRPSFVNAADPAFAKPAFAAYVEALRGYPLGRVAAGEFGADMRVEIVNDGPVTIVLDAE